jgi:DNA-binding NarL/FixJ family response regulator
VSDPRHMKVLLVEENSAVRSVVRQLVMSPGTWIQECVNAADAVAAYAASRPDCVIMGIGTKDPDGIAVSRQIKEMDPAARIILLSDYDDAAMRVSARNAGACGYVLKDNLLEVTGLLRINQGEKA